MRKRCSKASPTARGYYIEHLLPTKCQMDVNYVRERSFRLDFGVLWETGKIITLSLIRRLLGRNSPPAEAVVSTQTFTAKSSYARHDAYRDDKDEVVAQSGS